MIHYPLNLGRESVNLNLPEGTDILSMSTPQPLQCPADAIQNALANSIGSPGLDEVIQAKLQDNPAATAAIVISDNTRPVPYRGDAGILWPIVERLLQHGVDSSRIVILVATGTHRPVTSTELREMLDPRVFIHQIPVRNHNCRDAKSLCHLGQTSRGTQVYINQEYVNADIKILTGLVESHFMAGASGGRKSVCPGLIGEESTYIFHGASMLASSEARDLVLAGNPCHEEALEVARMAGADYIVNVTLDHKFRVTGVFAGDLERAHEEAVQAVFSYVSIPISEPYDIVVTHAGFVGINHYQAGKVAVASLPALKPNGRLIVVANNTDTDPVGSAQYRTVLHLLKIMGPERFNQLLLSPDWTFIPDQWQVQMWSRLFHKTVQDNVVYYSPQLSEQDYAIIPGTPGTRYLDASTGEDAGMATAPLVVTAAIAEVMDQYQAHGRRPTVAYLVDGPYGIPVSC